MLELRTYTIDEMFSILSVNDRQGIQRKLNRYGVEYSVSGWGTRTEFEITNIADEFKLFCILDLEMSANTDFEKFLYFMYYFLNDDDFHWFPNKTIETEMTERDKYISRQTISRYKDKLEQANLFHTSCEYVYYFARGDTQIETDKKTYSKAWREYWENQDKGLDSREAICIMCAKYGGVARKQAIMEENAIHADTINKINEMVCKTIEKDLS